MLNEGEKMKIREEEKYRVEVANGLRVTKTKAERLLAFLNTGLGLWILSTVFVGGASVAWNSCQDNRERKLIMYETNRKLELEMTRQMYTLKKGLDRTERKNYDAIIFIDEISKVVELDKPIFEENKKQTLSSLIWQLMANAGHSNKKYYQDAFEASLKLEQYGEISPSVLSSDSVKNCLVEIKRTIVPKFDRWME